jgi:Polyketide cyclase / dehydrase and lipid transport
MRVERSILIQRPVGIVWDFYAVHHVENHPRWDPTIELRATADDPIAVGTIIERRVTRFGRTTEGTMEVVEFEPETAMRVETHDGPMTIHGWARFEAVGPDATRLTIGGEIPGLDEAGADQVGAMMERSTANIRSLVESD